MMVISRQQFIDAIEAGIENSADLPNDDVIALRKVAQESEAFRYGSFLTRPYCPATQAGIYSNGRYYFDPAFYRFVDGFDNSITDLIGEFAPEGFPPVKVVRVVG